MDTFSPHPRSCSYSICFLLTVDFAFAAFAVTIVAVAACFCYGVVPYCDPPPPPPEASRSVLLSADYSQIEMRVLAHCCRDPAMLRLFELGAKGAGDGAGDGDGAGAGDGSGKRGDIYLLLGAEIFRKPVSEVTNQERQRAKTVCLGIVYGMGTASLGKKLGISQSEARSLSQRFLATYPRLSAYVTELRQNARRTGFVTTLLGRRRSLPDLNHRDSERRSYAERQCLNTVVQGSASDLIKLAMLSVDRALRDRCRRLHHGGASHATPLVPSSPSSARSAAGSHPGGGEEEEKELRRRNAADGSGGGVADDGVVYACGCRVLLQIHDELVIEVTGGQEELNSVVELVHECMEQDVKARMNQLLQQQQKREGTKRSYKHDSKCNDSAATTSVNTTEIFSVPLVVNVSAGATWGSLEKL